MALILYCLAFCYPAEHPGQVFQVNIADITAPDNPNGSTLFSHSISLDYGLFLLFLLVVINLHGEYIDC
jgi:hypothetical protein